MRSIYQAICENQSSALLVLDQDLRVIYMNASAEIMFERSVNQSLGEHFSNMAALEHYDHTTMLRVLDDHVSLTHRSESLQLVDGRQSSVDITLTPLRERGNSALLLECFPVDRIRRISTEQAALDKQEASQELIRGVAHEVKNPLGGIRGAAQLLTVELGDSELVEYTEVIINEVDRLRNLVDRMLGLSKPPQFKSISIHQVTERILQLLNAEQAGKLRLTRDYDPSLPDVMADQEQLIQAVLNIARNAMQAMAENDTEQAEIVLKTRVIRQHTINNQRHKLVVKLDIIDNGPGIPSELLGKIFYPMISGRAAGTGLGLSIAQQIVSLHQGQITCESEPGCTTFSLLLPLGV